jgi:hypothetical protein
MSAPLPRYRDFPISYQARSSVCCTSFNTGDAGTLVYKNPLSPIAKQNYYAGNYFYTNYRFNGYWINGKHNKAVSLNIDYFNQEASICISGKRLVISYLFMGEPIACSLANDDKLVVLFRDNNNYVVVSYQYHFSGNSIIPESSTKTNITTVGFPNFNENARALFFSESRKILAVQGNQFSVYHFSADYSSFTTNSFSIDSNEIIYTSYVQGNKILVVSLI